MPTNARQLALRTLAQWTDLAAPPLVPERDDPRWAALPSRERNFAFDLINGVLRHRMLLEAVIASRLKRPLEDLEPKVLAILWLGAYELLLREQGRAYAAVHSTVELARRSGHPRAAGLVNAVLRGITRLKPAVEVRHGLSAKSFPRDFGTQICFLEPVFPQPEHLIAHLAAVTSHPAPLVEMLIRAYGEHTAMNVLIRDNLRPSILLRADADLTQIPHAQGIPALGPPSPTPAAPASAQPPNTSLVPHEVPGYYVAAGGWTPEVERLVATGALSPQDPTAGKAIRRLVDVLPRGQGSALRILDLCAGLGTKTIQLARALPEAQIVATDIDAGKLARLTQRATQLALPNITARPLAQAAEGPRFDAVLIDAPCSNTGVLGRRVQSRWRWPALDRQALVKIQVELLRQGAALLAPGGWLVYATCSIDPMENQGVVKTFLAEGQGLKLHAEELTLPAASDAPAEQYDGGYVAVLKVPPV